jgi:uncharacterized protein (TIGR00299 family) protein
MRILYFDAFSGVSGDMTVGALIGLGAPLGCIEAELATLALGGYRLRAEERVVRSIAAWKFDVEVEHEHGGHMHRSFADIRRMLGAGGLRPEVQERALAIFTRLAEAEGRVHGVPTDDVTFHEVGAVDSIVDIVATSIGLVELGVESVHVSALPLGSGMVVSSHGPIPVPGPATVDLLKGFAVRLGDGNGELVTPTGAAIVSALAVPAEPLPALRVERVGYGAGTRTLADRPNVLRLVLGSAAVPAASDEMVLVETNIDDSNPEIYAHVMELLFEAGARDVWLAPIQMKKNRPAVRLSAIGEPASRALLAGIILRETSAIGVRFSRLERVLLQRETITVETEYGPVAVKRSEAPDGTLNLAPEYESCRRVARERGVPLKLVYAAALAAARNPAIGAS